MSCLLLQDKDRLLVVSLRDLPLCPLFPRYRLTFNNFAIVESVIWLAAYIKKGDHGSVVAEALDLVGVRQSARSY